MGNPGGLRAIVAALVCAAACNVGDGGNTNFGPGGGGIPPGDGGDDGGDDGASDGGDDGTADDGGPSGDDGGLSGTGNPTGSGDGMTTGDDGGAGGPACGNAGDLVVQGTAGAANANQNCPTTDYTANVSGAMGNIADVEVLLTASVATTSEFTATLRSPGGTSVTLFDKHGGPFSDDFIGTHFDDASTMPIATATPPRTGCFAPDQPLSAFNGQPADGTWVLTVQTCLYAVTIQSWELRLTL